MDGNIDNSIRQKLEQLSNTVSRHRFLEKAAKGILASAAALTVGGLGIQSASAMVGCCCSTESVACHAACPGGCINQVSNASCPSGYTLCKCSDCPGPPCCSGCTGYCDYSSGYWGCVCGSDLYYCVDCWKGSCSSGATDHPCTCSARAC